MRDFTILFLGHVLVPAMLTFEITYDDAESKAKTISYGNRLDLVERKREFQPFQNPYYTGTPVQDQSMFYGREEEFAFLREDFVHSSANTVVVLYGQRRSGKSSLLYQLLQRPILSPHIPVRLDMQHETLNFSTSRFLRSLALNIHKELRKQAIIVLQPQKADFDEDPILALDVFLDDVEAMLEGRKIVILIDEFEILEDKAANVSARLDVQDTLIQGIQAVLKKGSEAAGNDRPRTCPPTGSALPERWRWRSRRSRPSPWPRSG